MRGQQTVMPGEGTTDKTMVAAPLLILVGPTAIGKTELALELAEEFACEIVGVDSMQIYRYMDIGTAKPSARELARVRHHLIDYVLPDEDYSAARFVVDCQAAVAAIRAKGRIPLLAGGTGLYFSALEHGMFQMPDIPPLVRQGLQAELQAGNREALLRELGERDPHSAARIHANDTYRLLRALEIVRATGKPWSRLIAEHQAARQGRGGGEGMLKLGLSRERQELYQRIDQRVEQMLAGGLLAEVESLLGLGYGADLRPMQSLGYRHMLRYLAGEWSWEESRRMLAQDTRRYAKRQLTWFRADQDISWFSPGQASAIKGVVAAFLHDKFNIRAT